MSSQSSPFPPRDTTPSASDDADSFAVDDTSRGATRTPPPNPTRRPVSTPLSNKIAGNRPYSSVAPDQDEEFRLRLAAETAGLFLGPVPCDSFLNTFLPIASSTQAGGCSNTQIKFDAMSLGLSEAQMYQPFVSISLSRPWPVQLTCLQRSMQLISLHPI